MHAPRRLGALVFAIALLIPATSQAAVSPPWDPFFATPGTVADIDAVVGGGAADTRPYGNATGDFDGDGELDMVIGRTSGHVMFAKGNGNGTFQAPTIFSWKQTTNNAWSMTAGDANDDGNLDVIWGANTDNNGCLVSGCTPTLQVADGEVRAWLGNGNGTFQLVQYTVSGVVHNKGVLLADVGTDAGSVDAADVNADGFDDVVVGSLDTTNSAVKLLTNNLGGVPGTFSASTILSQPSATSGDGASPTYFPVTTPTTSPWGLALGDADNDGDTDLFVGDRALYVYLYKNNGTGSFTITPGNIPQIAPRPNVYLRHDPTFRAAVGFTPSLAAGDIDGDGRADLAVGLHSGTQTVGSNTVHDGEIVLNLSKGGRHELFGVVGDVGTNARGIQIEDFNGDGARDIVTGELSGDVKLLRQLPPLDTDDDGISDYVDNAPENANAPRIDTNTDGAITHLDQLDNDGDTVLGDPENDATWVRLGDVADEDDDNDGTLDGADNCRLVANAGQVDADSDDRGDACDPLDDRDGDADGVPTGPDVGDPLYAESLAAAKKWSEGDTHFVIRIDAMGRLFQNEFTGLMTDGATLSEADFAVKCQGMYNAPPADPDPGCATLPGGKEVPVSLVTIPRLLWTDPEVVTWINDRNDSPRFDLGQHGTYHFSNTTLGDWKDLGDRNFFSCETCGLDVDENYELLKIGKDTLEGNYANPALVQSGATGSSPKIDWSTSANPLISYAPPFNASDTASREATAALGYKSFSASVHEENPLSLGQFFSPEGSHHEEFDQFGMFHASADTELEPPTTSGGSYDPAEYEDYLQSETNDGGLTTWLIEEVEWSGRPCNELDRLNDLCGGLSNRENNTVYRPRWDGWLQLLDYVKNYPGGVAMTMGEVALAKGYDNAPTADNADQADADHDGIGDVIDDAGMVSATADLVRNAQGELSATLTNGDGDGIDGQEVTFSYDADDDGTPEDYTGTTDSDGVATVDVTPTRPVGPSTFTASWDGGRGVTASDSGDAEVRDVTTLTLGASNPTQGQVTDSVTVAATLVDSDGSPLEGKTVRFAIGSATGSATTDASGVASRALTLVGPAGAGTLTADFDAEGSYGQSNASAAFTVLKENTTVTLSPQVTVRTTTTLTARLLEADGAALSGRTIAFFAEVKTKKTTVWEQFATAQTNGTGFASVTVPAARRNQRKRADFAGDTSFLSSTAQIAGS